MGKKNIHSSMLLVMFALFGTSPLLTHAQIIINEIQYNPEGADGGYEWVELHNSSESALSIEGFTFRESDKNHRLVHTNEALGWLIPQNGYAIIADNPTKFLEKHPGYPGLLFDSSFTLVNTGESLELLDTDDELVVGITYNPEWGGNGDGSTLGIHAGAWRQTSITPGRANEAFQVEPQQETFEETPDTSDQNTTTQEGPSQDTAVAPVADLPATYIRLADPTYKEKTIKADAGPDRTLLSGVPFLFTGIGYGLAGGILDTPEYYWNFGDGQRERGKQVIHHYAGPGSYTGTLRVVSGKYSHTDHFIVTVVPPKISLSASFDDQNISLSNNSPHIIELSGFSIEAGTFTFTFPEESFISGTSRIVLDAHALGLEVSDAKRIYLKASNGHTISSYHGAVEQIKKQIALAQETTTADDEKASSQTALQESTEAQIVYVGVPQTTSPAQQDVAPYEPLLISTTTQQASIGSVKKELFSPFELALIAGLSIAGSVFGYIEFKRYRKEKSPTYDIEEL